MKREEKIVALLTAIIFAVAFLVLFRAVKCAFAYFDLLSEQISKVNTVEVVKTVYVEVPVQAETEMPVAELNYIKNEPNYIIDVTDEEIELLARVVMSESSICDIDVKYAVATTIVNRVLSDDFPNTVTEVVYQNDAYSTQDNGEPNEECRKAVEWALTYQEVFPNTMYYFRTDHYHTFGTPLVKLGNMYFSTK